MASSFRSQLARLALVAAALFCGCESGEEPLASAPAEPVLATGSESRSLELARSLAAALNDPRLRSSLVRSMRGSPVKEAKLHLQNYLRAEGQPLLRGLERSAAAPGEALLDRLEEFGPLEIYLPVPVHRGRWKGGSDLLVVVHLDEEEVPVGVDLDGRVLPLSLAAPPSTAVLTVVPAESFDERGVAHAAHLRPGAHRPGTGSAALAGEPIAWTGIWVNEVHVGNTHESWTRGSPEFEMHLENASVSPRVTVVCAEEDYSVEPYRWDMDKKDYYDDFLIGAESEIPRDTPVVISMWEDDDGRCVLKVLNGYDWVKLVTDALRNAYDVYKAVEKEQFLNGQFVMKVVNAYIAYRAIVTGSDDFMGVAAGQSNVTGVARKFVLKDHNRINQGWLMVQWRTVLVE